MSASVFSVFCRVSTKLTFYIIMFTLINKKIITNKRNHNFILFNSLTLYLIETPFYTFANRADQDQAALVRSGSSLFDYGNMIRYDPTLVDLTCNFFVLCTNMKVSLYNYS